MNAFKKAVFAATVAVAGFASSVHAELITNDKITLTSSSYTGDAFIGDAVEFSGIAQYLKFDFSTTQLIVGISKTLPSNSYQFSSTLGSFVFSGFDSEISGFTLASNSPQFKNFGATDYSLNDNSITLNFAGVAPANENAKLVFDITTKSVTPAPANNVPEPATVALLGLGLLGVATARRKSAKN